MAQATNWTMESNKQENAPKKETDLCLPRIIPTKSKKKRTKAQLIATEKEERITKEELLKKYKTRQDEENVKKTHIVLTKEVIPSEIRSEIERQQREWEAQQREFEIKFKKQESAEKRAEKKRRKASKKNIRLSSVARGEDNSSSNQFEPYYSNEEQILEAHDETMYADWWNCTTVSASKQKNVTLAPSMDIQNIPEEFSSDSCLDKDKSGLLKKHLDAYYELMKEQPKRHTTQQLEAERRRLQNEAQVKQMEELERLRKGIAGQASRGAESDTSKSSNRKAEFLRKLREKEAQRNAEESDALRAFECQTATEKDKRKMGTREFMWAEQQVVENRKMQTQGFSPSFDHETAPCPIVSKSLIPENKKEEEAMLNRALEMSRTGFICPENGRRSVFYENKQAHPSLRPDFNQLQLKKEIDFGLRPRLVDVSSSPSSRLSHSHVRNNGMRSNPTSRCSTPMRPNSSHSFTSYQPPKPLLHLPPSLQPPQRLMDLRFSPPSKPNLVECKSSLPASPPRIPSNFNFGSMYLHPEGVKKATLLTEFAPYKPSVQEPGNHCFPEKRPSFPADKVAAMTEGGMFTDPSIICVAVSRPNRESESKAGIPVNDSISGLSHNTSMEFYFSNSTSINNDGGDIWSNNNTKSNSSTVLAANTSQTQPVKTATTVLSKREFAQGVSVGEIENRKEEMNNQQRTLYTWKANRLTGKTAQTGQNTPVVDEARQQDAERRGFLLPPDKATVNSVEASQPNYNDVPDNWDDGLSSAGSSPRPTFATETTEFISRQTQREKLFSEVRLRTSESFGFGENMQDTDMNSVDGTPTLKFENFTSCKKETHVIKGEHFTKVQAVMESSSDTETESSKWHATLSQSAQSTIGKKRPPLKCLPLNLINKKQSKIGPKSVPHAKHEIKQDTLLGNPRSSLDQSLTVGNGNKIPHGGNTTDDEKSLSFGDICKSTLELPPVRSFTNSNRFTKDDTTLQTAQNSIHQTQGTNDRLQVRDEKQTAMLNATLSPSMPTATTHALLSPADALSLQQSVCPPQKPSNFEALQLMIQRQQQQLLLLSYDIQAKMLLSASATENARTTRQSDTYAQPDTSCINGFTGNTCSQELLSGSSFFSNSMGNCLPSPHRSIHVPRDYHEDEQTSLEEGSTRELSDEEMQRMLRKLPSLLSSAEKINQCGSIVCSTKKPYTNLISETDSDIIIDEEKLKKMLKAVPKIVVEENWDDGIETGGSSLLSTPSRTVLNSQHVRESTNEQRMQTNSVAEELGRDNIPPCRTAIQTETGSAIRSDNVRAHKKLGFAPLRKPTTAMKCIEQSAGLSNRTSGQTGNGTKHNGHSAEVSISEKQPEPAASFPPLYNPTSFPTLSVSKQLPKINRPK